MDRSIKVGIVGAGNMGSGIAQKMAQEGLSVVLLDIKDEFVQRGLSGIRNTLEEGVKRKIFSPDQVDLIMGNIVGTTDFEQLADADLVLEAVFEDEKVKGDLFSKLDKICSEKTILATNTSSFYVKNLAKYTDRPDKVIGMHYFYHPAKNRLLEIIPHEGTSEETIERAMLISKLHGKTTILVKDSPGFAVNRFFIPWYVEAIRIYEEGVANIPTIEVASKKAFGIGMGTFELINVTGVPIALHSANTLSKEIGPFYAAPDILKKQVESGEDWDLSGEVDDSKIDIVADRMYATVMGVAATMVEEGVASIEDTDRGAKIGLRWRYGPFELINRVGVEKAYQLVKDMSERHSDFKMPALLEKQKQLGKPFEFNFVDLEVKDDIAYITINRPEAMNALNPLVAEQLTARFDDAEKDPSVKGIVFSGAGKAFVAGADIKFFVDNIKNNTVDKTYEFTREGHDLLLKIENSEKLTIALLDGLSLGGGSELAFACQAIVATRNGTFGFPETNIGIFPGLGGMIRIERHLGRELAKYFVFTGKGIKAEEAYQMGVVTKLVEPAQTEAAIKELVAKGKFDKYSPRELPKNLEVMKAAFSDDNVKRLLAGQEPEGVDSEVAAKLVKIIKRKAPVALNMANELIDAQSKVSIKEAVELELQKLHEIFATEDALAGLSTPPGTPVEFKGK